MISILMPQLEENSLAERNTPPQPRRGGCAIKKMPRSHHSWRRRGGAGQEIHRWLERTIPLSSFSKEGSFFDIDHHHELNNKSTPNADARSSHYGERASSEAAIACRRISRARQSVNRCRISGSSRARSASFIKSLTMVSVLASDSKSRSGPVAMRTDSTINE